MHDYRVILRRLALRDDRYLACLLADEEASADVSQLDPRVYALVRIGALIAMNAAPASFLSACDDAQRAGATHEEIVGTLIAALPIVGVTRIVSAAPNLGLGLGYDVAEAFELLDNGDLST